MQSGLRNDINSENIFSDIVRLYVGTDTEGIALDIPSVKAPGQTFEYNNANTAILGIIQERATGQSLESYTSASFGNP